MSAAIERYHGAQTPAERAVCAKFAAAIDRLVARVSLPIGANTVLMGSDVSEARARSLRVGNNVQIYLATESLAKGQRLFDALTTGGTVTLPFEKTTWAERFGSCVDRFGVHWMIDFTGDARFGEA